MITYDPFWKTIKEKNVSTYKLIKDYKISSSTIDRLRSNKAISTTTVNTLCEHLDCEVEDILKYS